MDVHHARVYTFTERSEVMRELALLRELYAVTVIERVLWGIGDSRALVAEIYKTESSGKMRVFALICGDITVEAQNALLKIVEEPPAHSRMVFFLAPEATLLPTLRSRVQIVGGSGETAAEVTPTFVDWEKLPLREKMSTIEAKLKKKDEVWMEQIVRGAITVLEQNLSVYPAVLVQRLYRALELVGTRGASNKMLLEEVALLFSRLPKKR